MIQFFAPDINTDPILPEGESQHAVRVLRLSYGDELQVTDGKGHRYRCVILDPHPKRTLVEVVECNDIMQPWPCDITVAVAPTKHLDRMEWMLEKMVEIGINRFVPVLCRRSERKELKVERMRKIALSAMNQSLKATLPEISPMIPLAQFVKSLPADSDRFVGYCDDNTPRVLFSRSVRPASDTVVLIGPEGDFSPEEITMLTGAGFSPVTFGDIRLRTETAAVCALNTIHVINQLA